VVLAVAVVLCAGAALGLELDAKCQALKNKDTGKLAFCLQKAEMKLVKTRGLCSPGGEDCYRDDDCAGTCEKDLSRYNTYVEKCRTKFFQKWATDELKGEGQCLDGIADPNLMLDFVTYHSDGVAQALAGDGFPVMHCGNGVAEVGESCDGIDLNGETCASLGYDAGAQLVCTSECKFDLSGCEAASEPDRFRDNGDGTATDTWTGLMWEVKEAYDSSGVTCKTESSAPSCANPHDADNRYQWCEDADDAGGCDNGTGPFDGPVVTVFLEQLNNRCDQDVTVDCTAGGDADCSGVGGACGHAGYRDWRLPAVGELRALLRQQYMCDSSPCIDGSFPGPTVSSFYWSSSAYSSGPFYAWSVYFYDGYVLRYNDKYFSENARGVRGGL